MRTTGGWAVSIERAGDFAEGVVHACLAALGVMVALEVAEQVGEPVGVMEVVLAQPYPRVLLGMLLVGLVGAAAGSAVRAVGPDDRRGGDGEPRPAQAAAAMGYGLLATVVGLAVVGGGDPVLPGAVSAMLEAGLGTWVLAVIGAASVAAGGWHLWTLSDHDALLATAARDRSRGAMAMAGYGARGLVLAVVGGFLLVAAGDVEQWRGRGLEGAYESFAAQPLGGWMIAVGALGAVVYGLSCFDRPDRLPGR